MTLKEFDRIGMGERIRLSREKAHLSREQLAEYLDITPKFLADIECGNRGLSMPKFALFIQILNVSADYLIFGNTTKR